MNGTMRHQHLLRMRSFLPLALAALLFGLSAQPPAGAQSTQFSSIAEEAYSTYQATVPGSTQLADGDLWPSCWASNGSLYAANGDGSAFSGTQQARYDMAVSQIAGNPPNLVGTTVFGELYPAEPNQPAPSYPTLGIDYVASDAQISDPTQRHFNDKPTGMLCLGGNLYLAYQNLATSLGNFTGAPSANVIMSSDFGKHWSPSPAVPMFGTTDGSSTNGLFTTIFFLDFGQNSVNAVDGYVYAYGLDHDWRSQTQLFLARVPANSASLLNSAAWQFYSGSVNGTPQWGSLSQKSAVLTDTRQLYATQFGSLSKCPTSENVIAQGGVVYDKPLSRYIYSSWSCSTHEFYEAPQPWGPWTHITSGGTDANGRPLASIDFGALTAQGNRGQYAPTIPSKYISADGLSMYLQSNVCCGRTFPNPDSYSFSLRKLILEPAAAPGATNPSGTNNLGAMSDAYAISKSTHYGRLCNLNCADQLSRSDSASNTISEDDFDTENKVADGVSSFWGYTWGHTYRFNQVVYTSGASFQDGGWFASGLTVQVRNNGQWQNISNITMPTPYPYNSTASNQAIYTFNFPTVTGDGVRIIGTPPAPSYFTAITHLGVYYAAGRSNLLADPGFELQSSSTVSAPWATEGPDAHGIDRGAGFAHTGQNNAWMRNSTTNFNSVIQRVSVTPNTVYTLSGWFQNNFGSNFGYFGARASDGTTVLQEVKYYAAPSYQNSTFTFNTGNNSVITIYVGFFGTGADQFVRVDDVTLQ